MAQGAVVAAGVPLLVETLRQAELFGDIARQVAFVDHAYGLIVQVLVHITLYRQEALDVVLVPDRPMMLGHQNVGFVAEAR